MHSLAVIGDKGGAFRRGAGRSTQTAQVNSSSAAPQRCARVRVPRRAAPWRGREASRASQILRSLVLNRAVVIISRKGLARARVPESHPLPSRIRYAFKAPSQYLSVPGRSTPNAACTKPARHIFPPHGRSLSTRPVSKPPTVVSAKDNRCPRMAGAVPPPPATGMYIWAPTSAGSTTMRPPRSRNAMDADAVAGPCDAPSEIELPPPSIGSRFATRPRRSGHPHPPPVPEESALEVIPEPPCIPASNSAATRINTWGGLHGGRASQSSMRFLPSDDSRSRRSHATGSCGPRAIYAHTGTAALNRARCTIGAARPAVPPRPQILRRLAFGRYPLPYGALQGLSLRGIENFVGCDISTRIPLPDGLRLKAKAQLPWLVSRLPLFSLTGRAIADAAAVFPCDR